jgi:hypothetical protein
MLQLLIFFFFFFFFEKVIPVGRSFMDYKQSAT